MPGPASRAACLANQLQGRWCLAALPQCCVLSCPSSRPFVNMNILPLAGGAMLAMDLGFMGPNYPIATACATGNYCILR